MTMYDWPFGSVLLSLSQMLTRSQTLGVVELINPRSSEDQGRVLPPFLTQEGPHSHTRSPSIRLEDCLFRSALPPEFSLIPAIEHMLTSAAVLTATAKLIDIK